MNARAEYTISQKLEIYSYLRYSVIGSYYVIECGWVAANRVIVSKVCITIYPIYIMYNGYTWSNERLILWT